MFNVLKKYFSNYPLIYSLIKRYPLRFYRNFHLKETKFPSEVWLENTNHCNAKCIMCPRDSQTRDKGIMDFDLYSKVIKEVSNFGHIVKRVHMHNFGEPLLDKRLPDRIKMAKELGIKHVYFVTNASLLTKESSIELIKSGLDELKISFYGTDEESYNKTMKRLDFNKTLENVRGFFKAREDLGAKNPRVVVQLIPQLLKNNNEREWMEIFEDLIDTKIGDSLNFFELHNFGGGSSYINTAKKIITNTCNYPWRVMVILQDGSVSPCCLDYNGEINLGNVNMNTIQHIWNNEKYTRIRKDFKKLNYSKYSACGKCDIPSN